MNDIFFMQRAINLAQMGFGKVSPNPMVGCVIVYENKIIGEGYHQQFGQAHAEVNAVNSVKEINKKNLSNATFYVTLEPCSHYGKTPPCADLLADIRPKKIVVAHLDSNPLVAGKGIEKLKNLGIEVLLFVLKNEVYEQNRRFFTFFTQKRPYIILKWAMTNDHFVAKENFDSKWISHDFSRKIVHQWRTEENAILVGKNTAFYDNPKLNARDWDGRQPTRIVLDNQLNLPQKLHLFDESQPTIVYNQIKNDVKNNLIFVKIPAEISQQWQFIFADLYQKNIQSLIIEGGAMTLKNLIQLGLWDEARVFEANKISFGKGIEAPKINQLPQKTINFQEDTLKIYRNYQTEIL
ncbi:MAG: bifunctional diaminohydroxyphosphoribosylaminopyrimidine deaminase/5-amino-6-(5-phosphoribosylamino)uracil reductase RibD [Bacteroidetes bacterium]|nr:MAG: bifunctional diaminohydroxyphosphoribosylaminopyrimidine deaminase/5-amino-6-(5-phosphoribosylamino)uracil reductase RibD [Bacteroidota bacterium]TAG89534.1 MAG: bifunctional diaminohydroxyphosphoribosylaminopyrimidine deaminase/5-amino-6-(5-phosphoribosylamino)uracil reductase RibD [Bacteroidota bacterium]